MDIKNLISFDLRNLERKTIRNIVIGVVVAVALLIGILVRGSFSEGDLIQTDSSGGTIQTEQSADNQDGGSGSGSPAGDPDSSGEDGSSSEEVQNIYLDVSGAVYNPSVVCIPEGSRIYQAIEAAGGRTEDSDVRTLNLASVCEDGQKIYVPTKQEVLEAQETGAPLPGQEDGSAAGSTSTVSGNGSSSGTGDASGSGKVNINTAGSEELQTLTGVGPAIASKIIDYRNTVGPFNNIDEIVNVSGIGEKTYEKFKDQICV